MAKKQRSKSAKKQKAQTVYRCLSCGESRDGTVRPRGWHEDTAGNIFCKPCWHKSYVLRAVTIPVAGPVDVEWPELRESLKACWQLATRLKNWGVSVLAGVDVVRTPDMKKLPKMPPLQLYKAALACGIEMGGDRASVASIFQAVDKTYRKRRFELVWLGKISLPSYRYPQPFPIHNATWKALRGDDGQALVEMRINGKRQVLRLRGGNEFRRQLKMHAQLADGEAVRGEAALLEKRASKGDHRNGTTGRDENGGKTQSRVMCKMVGWFPRDKTPKRSGAMFATTSADAMIVALNAKQNKLWSIHADHVMRWGAAHRRQLHKWSEDQKRELRPDVPFSARRKAACDKFNRRMDTAADQIAAQIVGYANRCKFAELRWITGQPKLTTEFRWARMLTRIEQKCDEAGIAFILTEGSPKE